MACWRRLLHGCGRSCSPAAGRVAGIAWHACAAGKRLVVCRHKCHSCWGSPITPQHSCRLGVAAACREGTTAVLTNTHSPPKGGTCADAVPAAGRGAWFRQQTCCCNSRVGRVGAAAWVAAGGRLKRRISWPVWGGGCRGWCRLLAAGRLVPLLFYSAPALPPFMRCEPLQKRPCDHHVCTHVCRS